LTRRTLSTIAWGGQVFGPAPPDALGDGEGDG